MTTARVERTDAHVRAWLEAYLAPRTEWDGDCLVWTRSLNSTNTPVTSIHGRSVNVRRLVFSVQQYPVGPKLCVVSGCGNSRCLSHLQAMAKVDVARWLGSTGRLSTPACIAARRRNGRSNSKYTMAQARQARELRSTGTTLRRISELTGLPGWYVSRICAGKAWPEHASNASVFSLAGAR